MKRSQPDSGLNDDHPVSTPKRQKTTKVNGSTNGHVTHDGSPELTPSNRTRSTPQKPNGTTPAALKESGLKTPTQKAKARALFSTPTKATTVPTSTRARNADRSAKRKSARVLFEQDDEDVWDGGDKLAEEILEGENDLDQPAAESEGVVETVEPESKEPPANKKAAETPKRRAGRPKGAKNKRSPTPEGELPPHERYFFQNRAGNPRTSNNTLNKVSLLSHEDYFEKLSQYADPCRDEKDFLAGVHQRSFPQWNFEFDQGFNICLYGYGAKRKLVHQFADWLYGRYSSNPLIVMVNGNTHNISIRSIFATIVTAVLGTELPSKLGSQPIEVLELLQSALKSSSSSQEPITVLINSIDAPPLRRGANQALLARLAATPKIRLLATADTPNFLLMWDISLRDQFNFLFHDCTTFAPFDTESDVVEEVHGLVGRKSRRAGGKDGVGFVLKSLPENARNLYRLLLAELVSMMDEGHHSDDEVDGGAEGGEGHGAGEETGIEFRMLYQKASEEFIASSEMMFRTLLKEFHDHQMITSRMDASGSEILGVPLSREEMEGILEDLVLN